MLINDNRWRAMRYSFDEGLIDLAKGEVVPYATLLEEIIEFVEEDAEVLGCLDEIYRLRGILERGTSAHQQIRVYNHARSDGKSEDESLKSVVDWLINETVHGI